VSGALICGGGDTWCVKEAFENVGTQKIFFFFFFCGVGGLTPPPPPVYTVGFVMMSDTFVQLAGQFSF